MKLTRTRWDDFRWAAASRTGKIVISLVLVCSVAVGAWSVSPQAVAWFYDTTGLVPPEVQAERDREQELRLELSAAIPRAQITLDEAPNDESLEQTKDALMNAIDVGQRIFDDQSSGSEDIISAIEGIDRTEQGLLDAIAAYEQRLLDEGYDQLQQTIEDGVDVFNSVKGDDDYKSQASALRDAIRQGRSVLEERELDLVGVQETRTEILQAIEAVEQRAEEIKAEKKRERENQNKPTPPPTTQNPPTQNPPTQNPPTQNPPTQNPPTQNPPTTHQASTSLSLTCSSRETVTISASGGGTVTVTVSGAASGRNSGSGSASVTVTAQGTISATATASGSVSISASATATCR